MSFTFHINLIFPRRNKRQLKTERKRNKESKRFNLNKNNQKTEKLYSLPKNFSKPVISSKFDYDNTATFEWMKPNTGVTLVQNKKMK